MYLDLVTDIGPRKSRWKLGVNGNWDADEPRTDECVPRTTAKCVSNE